MSEQKFKVGDRVRVIRNAYTFDPVKEAEIIEFRDNDEGGYYNVKVLSGETDGVWAYKEADFELIPQGEPYTIKGKTYYAFPEGKTIKELGITNEKKLIVICDNPARSDGYLLSVGDVVILDDKADCTTFPFLKRLSDGKRGLYNTHQLAYYDEEVEEEELETSVREHYGGRCAIQQIKESNNLTKPKGNKLMSNIVKFAKDAALAVSNPDEKLRREVGLKDEIGNWTGEAMEIVFSLESQALGYKDTSDMVTTLGIQGGLACTAFELHALFVKYDAKLLEIAKAKKAEDKK